MADPDWSMNLDVSSPQFDPQKVAISKPWVHRAALIAVAYAARTLIQSRYITWCACLRPSFRRYQYCLVNEAHGCEQLPQGCYDSTAAGRGSRTRNHNIRPICNGKLTKYTLFSFVTEE